MNQVVLTGRLTNDPDIRCANNGTTIAKFTLACNRKFKQEEGAQADFIRCAAFGKTAEFIEKYFKKGQKMDLSGRIQTGDYTDNEGVRHYTTEVIIENVEFGESKKEVKTESKTGWDIDAKTKDGFINIPEELQEELPFN